MINQMIKIQKFFKKKMLLEEKELLEKIIVILIVLYVIRTNVILYVKDLVINICIMNV